MRSALDVHQALLARDVGHEMVHLRTRVASADDLPHAIGLSHGCAAVRCYVIVGREPTGVVAVAVPAGTTPDPGAVLAAVRDAGLATPAQLVRPAAPDEVNAATDFAAALVSPVGLPPGVPLLIDARLAAGDVVYTAAGEGGVALGIRTRDLLAVTGAHVADLEAAVVDLTAADTHGHVEAQPQA